MNPFILKFKTEPTNVSFSNQDIEYSTELNLNVLKSTYKPAICLDRMGTDTFTKTQGEGSDADNSFEYYSQLDTNTFTRVVNETSDMDY